jgi:predicted Zn finger-like uncharacterized protein
MNVTCPNCATVYRVDPAKVPAAGVRARCNVCSAVFAVRREGDAELAAAPSAGQQSERKPPEPVATKPQPPSPPAQAELPKSPLPSAPPRPTQPVVTVRPPSPATSGAVQPSVPAPRPVGPQRPTTPTNSPVAPAGIAAPASSSSPRPGPTLSPPAAAPRAAPPPVAPAAPKPATPPAAPPGGAVPKAAPASVTGGRPANPFLSQDPALKARRLARALISDMVVYHPGKRQEGLRDGNLKALFDEEIKKSWEEYAEQVGREVADSTPYFREALNEILAGGRQIF